jgi:hypothetical protein
MKTFKVFLLVLAAVLLFTAAFPIPAAASVSATSTNSKLTITNKSLGQTYVYLTGPKGYTINAPIGKTVQEIQKGDYTYKYKACGVEKTGKLNAKAAQAKLIIPACKVAVVYLFNFGSGTASLSLSGPANYNITAGPDSLTKLTVLEGSYRYSLSGSCVNKSGTALLKGKKNLFWVDC